LHEIIISVMIIIMKHSSGVGIMTGGIFRKENFNRIFLVFIATLIAFTSFWSLFSSTPAAAADEFGAGWQEVYRKNNVLNGAYHCLSDRFKKWDKTTKSDVLRNSNVVTEHLIGNIDFHQTDTTTYFEMPHIVGDLQRCEAWLNLNLETVTYKKGMDVLAIFANCKETGSGGEFTCDYYEQSKFLPGLREALKKDVKDLTPEQEYALYHHVLTLGIDSGGCGVNHYKGADKEVIGDYRAQIINKEGVIENVWFNKDAGKFNGIDYAAREVPNGNAVFSNNGAPIFDSKSCEEIIGRFENVRSSFGVGKTEAQHNVDEKDAQIASEQTRLCKDFDNYIKIPVKSVTTSIGAGSARITLQDTPASAWTICRNAVKHKANGEKNYCSQLGDDTETNEDENARKRIADAKLACNKGFAAEDYEPYKPSEDSEEGEEGEEEPSCKKSVDSSLGWIICPATEGVLSAIDWAYEWIFEHFMNYQTLNENSGVKDAWGRILPIANIAFAIVFLVVIYSTVIGGKL